MQIHKITNYEKIYGVGTFAPFRRLGKLETSTLLNKFKVILAISESASATSTVKQAREKCFQVDGANAESQKIDFSKLLSKLQFATDGKIYLNWNKFDDVDEMKTKFFIESFEHIWYPSSDDLDLIDTKMRWLLSVDHSGIIWGLNLSQIGDR